MEFIDGIEKWMDELKNIIMDPNKKEYVSDIFCKIKKGIRILLKTYRKFRKGFDSEKAFIKYLGRTAKLLCALANRLHIMSNTIVYALDIYYFAIYIFIEIGEFDDMYLEICRIGETYRTNIIDQKELKIWEKFVLLNERYINRVNDLNKVRYMLEIADTSDSVMKFYKAKKYYDKSFRLSLSTPGIDPSSICTVKICSAICFVKYAAKKLIRNKYKFTNKILIAYISSFLDFIGFEYKNELTYDESWNIGHEIIKICTEYKLYIDFLYIIKSSITKNTKEEIYSFLLNYYMTHYSISAQITHKSENMCVIGILYYYFGKYDVAKLHLKDFMYNIYYTNPKLFLKSAYVLIACNEIMKIPEENDQYYTDMIGIARDISQKQYRKLMAKIHRDSVLYNTMCRPKKFIYSSM